MDIGNEARISWEGLGEAKEGVRGTQMQVAGRGEGVRRNGQKMGAGEVR